MPVFPGFTATTAPRGSGAVRATNIGALTRTSEQAQFSGLGAFGRGLQQAGGIAFQAAQHRQNADDDLETSIFTQKYQEIWGLSDKEAKAFDFSNDMPKIGDEDHLTTVVNYNTEIRDKNTTDNVGGALEKINKLISSLNPRVQERAQIYHNKNVETQSDRIRHTYAAGQEDWTIGNYYKLIETAAKNGELETAEFLIDQMDKHNLITPQKAEALKGTASDVAASAAVESIKPELIDAIAVSNKPEDGYKVLDMATAQLVKDGILTKEEAAEANKKLGDWIDSYVSGRIKAAKEADKLTTIQSYQKLSKPILDGELTYDDIDNSGLRETRRSGENVSDAERWRKYIKGSYKDAPTKNAPEGHTVSFAAVYDVSTLQLSPKEGYDVLLEARFVDGSITNEQFEWAVDKIENPYPKHVLEDLNATLKSNLEDFNRLFAADNERNKKVNEALLSWADDLIKKEKVPSKKEMFAMSSAFRAGGGQPYDIGRVIERGGRQWEIVGFDEDGDVIVEEIP